MSTIQGFAVDDAWLLICETSVRLARNGEVVSRLDFGEPLLAARWVGSQLTIRDAGGSDINVAVKDGLLTVGQPSCG
jgi:hypothetical protein